MATPWRFGAALLLALALSVSAQAQIVLTQDFTSATFPPTGWARFESGTGTGQQWVRISTTPTFAQSRWENVASGRAVDWLVTPLTGPIPSGGLLQFKMWQSFTGVEAEQSIYRVLISTASQTTPGDFTQVAQWNEATACPGGTGAPPTAAPAARNCSIDLSAYVGQSIYVAFQHDNDNGDNYNVDDIQIGLPPPASFAISPSTPVNFGAAGTACVGFSQSANFTITNGTGGPGLTVNSASVTGSPAYAVTTTPAPTYPVTVGGTHVITVTYNPTAAQTGPQTGNLVVNYTLNGTPQTATIGLYGSADAEGAGFVYRSSGTTGGGSCNNGVPAPTTGFIDIGGGTPHTQITTWVAGGTAAGTDDGRFLLDLATVFPSFGSIRMFGTDYTTLQIVTNGWVALGSAPLAPTGVYPDFYPTIQADLAGINFIAANAQDLVFATASTNYDTADPAQYPVGAYYGLENVDGTGPEELVITWFHAYNFGSGIYTASPQYSTFQLVIYQAANPNEEDHVEVRFPDGSDGATTPVPFRQNTTAGSPSLEADAAIGIGHASRAESAAYRDGTGFGGPVYAGTAPNGALAVRFQAETQEMANGQAGWRMLAAPVRDYTVGRLAGVNLVQGVEGQYPDYTENVLTGYDGTDYVRADNVTNVLASGRGFLWYLYDQAFDPGDTDGTSLSYELPTPLQGTGAEPALTGGALPLTLHATGNKWNLLGNPYRDDFDLTNIATWATGGTLTSAVAQIWDPNAGSTGSYAIAASNRVSAWQGFMIENNTATGLNVPPIDRTTGVVLVGRQAPPRMVAFELVGQTVDTQAPTLDRAAILYFGEDATADWDLRDAGKLAPLAARYATVAFVGERDGAPVLKAQESRALDTGSFDVPLAVSAVGTGSELTLSWPTFENVPAEWTFTLRDLATGATVDLRQQSSYTFTTESARAAEIANGMPVLGGAEARLADTRFVLHVASATTAGEGSGSLPTAFALHTPAPNPIVGVSALVSYDLPEASAARIEVYDMLGRRVATVVDGQVEAGRHTARLDASALASGSYVVRMTAGSFVQAQRVTVTR